LPASLKIEVKKIQCLLEKWRKRKKMQFLKFKGGEVYEGGKSETVHLTVK